MLGGSSVTPAHELLRKVPSGPRVLPEEAKYENEWRSLTWLLSMPVCAEVKRAVQDMSVVVYSIGEQNKEIAKVRQHRDMNTLIPCY